MVVGRTTRDEYEPQEIVRLCTTPRRIQEQQGNNDELLCGKGTQKGDELGRAGPEEWHGSKDKLGGI